jgi:hypothetical protein
MDPRYPIGKYQEQPYSEVLRTTWLNDIKFLPGLLEQSILNLDHDQLQTPYREGGWTLQQLVHHVADSHMNAYCRFKLGLTEENPVIRPYEEKQWALLEDVANIPINVSVTLLFALHTRWYKAIRHLTPDQWERTVFHPEKKVSISLWNLLGSYSWHGRHHVAHITSLRETKGW